MSTIEKAAAMLAARGKTAMGPVEPSLTDQQEAHQKTAEEKIAPEKVPQRARAASQRASAASPPEQTGTPSTGGNHSAPRRWCEINVEALTAKGFISPRSGRGQLAQEMRRIKRPLLLNIHKAKADAAPDTPPANLIMITSALADEGKTFIAINLAMSLAAELDRRVLLVDADVARGDITVQLEIEPARGLGDLLLESNYLTEDAVLTSNIERLSILPGGEPNDHIDELFASELMGKITGSLAAEDPQRIILFDAAPLLAATEPAVLARHMGQVVVVVEANKTPQDAVRQALAQVEDCANVSLVLNKTSQRESGGYAYGYGPYQKPPPAGAPPAGGLASEHSDDVTEAGQRLGA